MMGEHVKRSDALQAVGDIHPLDYNGQGIVERIKAIPAADVVEVQHGRFIGVNYDGYADGNPVYYEWICSQCGCVFEDDEPKMNYCPNCGAKMDGGVNDG